MRALIFVLVVFSAAIAAAVLNTPTFESMPSSVRSAVCGSSNGEGDGTNEGDLPGNKCDLKVSCKKCYFDWNYCNSCESTKKFLMCGTPSKKQCSYQSFDKCGMVIEHQATTRPDDCATCHGEGKKIEEPCEKSSCHHDLVE